MLLCLLDFCLWPRWSNRTGFTLISVKNNQIDKICEVMIFKTLDIRKQRTMSKRGKNGVSPDRPSWLPWKSFQAKVWSRGTQENPRRVPELRWAESQRGQGSESLQDKKLERRESHRKGTPEMVRGSTPGVQQSTGQCVHRWETIGTTQED